MGMAPLPVLEKSRPVANPSAGRETFSSTNSEKAVDLTVKCLTEFVAWAALISVARPPLANSTAPPVAG
jgi:hypothetical protein